MRTKRSDHRVRRQWWRPSVNLQLPVHENTSGIGPVASDAQGTDELTMEFLRAPKVVIVAESDPVCGRFRRAAISCRANALSDHLTRNPHARIVTTQDDAGHIIRGGIVNDDDA